MKTAATRLAPRLLRAPFSTAAPEVIFNPAAAPDVALITVNRQPLNPLSSSVARAIVSAAKSADADAGVRAVVLAGSGSKAFAAGADVKELAGYDHDKVRGGGFWVEKGKSEGKGRVSRGAMRSIGQRAKRPIFPNPNPNPTNNTGSFNPPPGRLGRALHHPPPHDRRRRRAGPGGRLRSGADV